MDHLINLLNQVALAAMRRSEVVGAFVVLAIVFMMITPLPTGLVDVLIAINICISCLLIMLAMHLPRPLAFSTFPSVLLITTMFRLALSISTTRLILLNQDAGHIVEAFGQFVVGGNLAVGMVIFMILTVVNFLVITKGSERVAEVGARFTLDAMPGKQMSIDSDLRANLISVHEARRRRSELGKESQLFGAMDGAMKFVNGDAIASLIIVAINMIGGIAIGVVQHGMSAGDAVQLYTVLTIGDGLIAQIPALLISVTSGMIITRVSNNDTPGVEANIGREIAEQITSQPKAWIIASVAMLGFAALPGMPTAVFVVIALICGCGGMLQLQRAKPKAPQAQPIFVAPENNGKEDLRTFIPSRQFLLQFHPQQNTALIEELVSEIRQRRNRLVVQYGLTLPSFIIETAEHLEPDEFRFSVYEVPLLKATFNQTHVAVDAQVLDATEVEQAVAGSLDRQESQWVWMPADAPQLQAERLETVSASTLIVERMERALQACGPQFIGLQETKAILGWLESEQPELAQEMQRVLPLARFSAVLQRLASECVPLRAIRVIAETLIEHGQHERDITALTDYVRIALKSLIYNQYSSPAGLLVWLLTPESEGILRDGLRQTQTETFFALSSETSLLLVQQLRIAFPLRTSERAVLLVAQDLRSPLRTLLQDEFHHVPVLSFAEISNAAEVKVLGRFDLEDDMQPLEDEYAA
ncbi:type III secretion system export apparatus subunit SctV [Pseudomonas gingeri]|uniref:Type III secretion system export apparatus subunit SctV n=1 Tax=Pseudomonas gingeri TaxID=117681 RepID=A0A7Y7Y9G3_9PSED|nr:type III secretion system export apparatus subunit SctV [Pseudomonas gingeri]NWA02057.1 type III secretion system export apparatus subunit SctV [Pseudomonas gingeri]NWA18150.1 type III secretion system export apparatus subunit SctV [Pseudomonas gingeri]NWA56269.1 type III secretion system export apparatus subunit SctV [Pseudomonas gingeri]NWA98847.1 type III secretion system export apparatus subunit SctV [Pseudomonas gingeri]NWB04834.1 type III secretion system export apparatus subunit SctV